MYRFCVIGHPIAHSKSPWIHQQFSQQFNLLVEYQKIETQPGHFAQTVKKFMQHGGNGLNITAPFKNEAFQLADYPSERAKLAEAANTFIFKNNKIYADNTDGLGLIHDIENNLNYSLSNKNILIIGAGGATRGILQPLFAAKPKQVTICNRTMANAEKIAKHFSSLGEISTLSFESLADKEFDVIFDATSNWNSILPLPQSLQVSQDGLCYDLKFSKDPTFFMLWAKSKNVKHICDGMGMLIEQAAIAFFLWTNKKPNTKPIIAKAREAFF